MVHSSKLIDFINMYLFTLQNLNAGVILIEACVKAARIAIDNHHRTPVHYFLQHILQKKLISDKRRRSNKTLIL